MIHFVGAGPGAADLITLRGQRLLTQADLIIYAGSLVNPELLEMARPSCRRLDSARMTLEEVLAAMVAAHGQGETVVRLHSGDPALFGAIREQMDGLAEQAIPYDVCPGVSSFLAAAAALRAEYTLPGVSQTVILCRQAGRTGVPEREQIRSLAAHQATMVVFLSTGLLPELTAELLAGGYPADTPAAIVSRASWPDQQVLHGTVSQLAQLAQSAGIRKTALILVGRFLGTDYELSRLYAADFTTQYREAKS